MTGKMGSTNNNNCKIPRKSKGGWGQKNPGGSSTNQTLKGLLALHRFDWHAVGRIMFKGCGGVLTPIGRKMEVVGYCGWLVGNGTEELLEFECLRGLGVQKKGGARSRQFYFRNNIAGCLAGQGIGGAWYLVGICNLFGMCSKRW